MTKEAPESAVPELEHKAAPSTVQALEVKPEGVVTAIVSVTGIVDEVNDLLEGGCYKDTLGRRKPKVIRNHDWNQQVGRVVQIEEYLPGDSRLPTETKDGQPWPPAAGALVATMQYNLGTDRGRTAFEDIKFYSDSGEAEFSIGYRVPAGGSRRRPDGVRQVKRLDLWEISDVLFGAAPLTMALSLKDAQVPGEAGGAEVSTPQDQPPAQPADPADPAEPTPVEPPVPVEPAPVEPAPEEPQLPAAPVADATEQPEQTEPEQTEPAPEPLPAPPPALPATPTEPDPATADPDPVGHAEPAPPAATIPAEPAPADPIPTDPAPEPEPADPVEPAMTDEQLAELHAAAIAEIDWDEIAAAAAETAAQLRAAADAPDQETATSEGQAEGEILTAAEVAEGLALLAEAGVEVKRKFSAAEREKAANKGAAMKDGSYPILNAGDLRNAIQALGRAKDRDAVKAHIIKRAKALKLTYLLPADWPGSTRKESKDAVGEFAEANAERLAELEVKAEGGADRNRGAAEQLRRWYVAGEGAAKIRWGQKGDFMRCVRIAQKHMRPDQAKGYCNLRHHDALGYYPATHAAREKAGRKSAADQVTITMSGGVAFTPVTGDDGKLTLWTPAAEVGPHAGYLQAKTAKAGPALAGSLEERREAVRRAAFDALCSIPGQAQAGDTLTLLGTWEDRLIIRRDREGEPDGEAFEIGYGTDETGRIVLGTPVPVELDVAVLPTAEATASSAVAEATAAVKTLLALRPLEVKEGRVLSGSNLARLRDAVTALLAVLAAAGVPIDDPSDKQVEDEKLQGRSPEPMTVPDTTSDGARDADYARKSAVISAEELAEGLALLIDA